MKIKGINRKVIMYTRQCVLAVSERYDGTVETPIFHTLIVAQSLYRVGAESRAQFT